MDERPLCNLVGVTATVNVVWPENEINRINLVKWNAMSQRESKALDYDDVVMEDVV